MERKASTPMRENRRRYEEKHKEERKAANKVFGTSIPRKDYEEIDELIDEIIEPVEQVKENIVEENN